MTNEYKANLCLHCLTDITRSCHNNCGYYERYKGMQQKDRDFKEYLKKKKEKLLLLQDNVSNQREFDLIDYRISLIDEIIKEQFGEEGK